MSDKSLEAELEILGKNLNWKPIEGSRVHRIVDPVDDPIARNRQHDGAVALFQVCGRFFTGEVYQAPGTGIIEAEFATRVNLEDFSGQPKFDLQRDLLDPTSELRLIPGEDAVVLTTGGLPYAADFYVLHDIISNLLKDAETVNSRIPLTKE